MSTASHADRVGRRAESHAGAGGLELGDAAWLALVPCALLTLAAIVVLGPPLGRLLFPPDTTAFWRQFASDVRPEPTEHARYLLALLGPLALSLPVLAHARRRAWARPPLAALAVPGAQALVAGAVVFAIVMQHTQTYAPYGADVAFRRSYFTWPTLGTALVVAALLLAVLRSPGLHARVAERTRERPAAHRLGVALAALLTLACLLVAINSDATIGNANTFVIGNAPVWLEETFATLDGRMPLVDFHAQYSNLWPYLAAGVMSLAGASFTAYAAVMVSATALVMAAVFALLRRIARSTLLALGLYAPFMATSFFTEQGPLDNRWSPVNAFSMFPMRYAGPYALAWLTARALDGRRPRRRALLLLGAGVVAINNVEFGIPALGATIAALVWTSPPRSRAAAARLAADVALGLAGAAALVALLTLAVAGSLPHYGTLFEFARIYGLDGFGMLPMPTVGFHLVLYGTFAAALVLATVRAAGRERDAVLTGMLAWAGVFGLGASAYWVGRSHPDVLIDLFSAWALALVLLTAAVVRGAGARAPLAQLTVLALFGLAVCSLAQLPAPWSQLQRLQRTTPDPALVHTSVEAFIGAVTRPGERIAILSPNGHRMAYDVGVTDVSPYASLQSMPTKSQLMHALAVLRAEGGHAVFYTRIETSYDVVEALHAAGYTIPAVSPDGTELELRSPG